MLSAMMSVQYISSRKMNTAVSSFVKDVSNSESDSDVLKLTEDFVNSFETTVGFAESNAGRKWIRGLYPTPSSTKPVKPTPTPPTKQPPIVYEPQICDSSSSPCLISINPDSVTRDEIGLTRITVTGQGFEQDRTLVYLCNKISQNCNSVVPNSQVSYDTEKSGDRSGVVILDEKTLTFILPSTLELSCRVQDEACLGGFIRGYPVIPGDYYIEVQTRAGTSNRLSFTISK